MILKCFIDSFAFELIKGKNIENFNLLKIENGYKISRFYDKFLKKDKKEDGYGKDTNKL